jgi:hypothetical protein
MNYESYLKSKRWKNLRSRFRRERVWRCEVCGFDRDLQLHHKTYERLGSEELDDLTPLCQTCHSALHQLEREGQTTSLNPADLFRLERILDYRRRRTDKGAKAGHEKLPTQHIEKMAKAERAKTKKRRENDDLARKTGGLPSFPAPEDPED